MKRLLSVLVMMFSASFSMKIIANPWNVQGDTPRVANSLMIYNDSNSTISYQFGRYPDEQMVDGVVSPHSVEVHNPRMGSKTLRLFVYFNQKTAQCLLFKSDFKYYNLKEVASVRVTSPDKDYKVICLDGGSESCVVN